MASLIYFVIVIRRVKSAVTFSVWDIEPIFLRHVSNELKKLKMPNVGIGLTQNSNVTGKVIVTFKSR